MTGPGDGGGGGLHITGGKLAASRFSRGRGRVEEKDGGMEGRGEAMQERRTKRGVVGWPYFLSGELYGGALRYDRRMDYHFSLFPPPPPPTLSPLSLYTPSLPRALSSCTSCKKARLLHALSTFSPPPCKDMQSGMGKGWVVGWPWSSRRALEGGLERRYTRMGKGGGELEGRSRQNVPRNVPFSVPLFLLPTVVTNTLEFSCAAGGWLDGGKRGRKKGKKREKGGERPMQTP